MPTYSSYGALDDQILRDGDVGFIGFNNRLRPDQLQAGMLSDAQNVRLDRNGEAQVRKGVELIVAPLSVGDDALTLPFTLPTSGQEGDGVTAILDDDAVNEIYGSCAYSDPTAEASQYIIIASNAKAIAIKVSDGTTTDIAYPALTTVSQSVDMIQAFNKVFIFRDGKTALEWDGDLSGSPAFTKVASGTYTQPVRLGEGGNNTTITNGVVTVTSTAHGLSVGDLITVTESSNSLTVGDEYRVATVPDADTFTFFAGLDDESSHNNHYSKKVSVGLGFSHMPAPPFAVYHQRRLVMPFNYTVDSSADSFTSRNALDEVIASDILDTDTYDQIYAQYRFNAGTADFVVGLHSFAEDTLLVFNRNSIHAVKNSSNVTDASVQLLTNEVGCLARKSIVQVGNRVIFLSDNGVYSTEFIDEYNLRGTGTPLSEGINSTIQRINKDYADKAVAVYFDNRYYIAVPIDGATENNAILIYNFLNNQWESIDQVDDANFHSTNLVIAGKGNNRGVYAVNNIGGVHKLDSRVDGIDRVVAQIGGSQLNLTPPFSISTRQYTLNTLERKKWKEFEFHIQSSEDNTSDCTFTAETENPDASVGIGTLSNLNGGALAIDEDLSLRGRIGNKRGHGIQFTFNNTSGRPRIRSVKVDGSVSMRSTTKAI